jgi:hypothetical protein
VNLNTSNASPRSCYSAHTPSLYTDFRISLNDRELGDWAAEEKDPEWTFFDRTRSLIESTLIFRCHTISFSHTFIYSRYRVSC